MELCRMASAEPVNDDANNEWAMYALMAAEHRQRDYREWVAAREFDERMLPAVVYHLWPAVPLASTTQRLGRLARINSRQPEASITSVGFSPGDARAIKGVISVLRQGLDAFAQSAAGTAIAFERAYAETMISPLESSYVFRDEDVQALLSANLDLVPVLHEIADKVPDYFGRNARLALEVIHDPEDGQDGDLYAVIQTSSPTKVALERLRAFDQGWWLERLRTIAGRLTVTLEYD